MLLFTKTTGFRHASLPDGRRAVLQIASQRGWRVTATEEASVFENLTGVDAVLFLNTTGDLFDERQRGSLQTFLTSGGGFIGVHAATDTEPGWRFWRDWLGAHFQDHPEIQEATVRVEETNHPATSFLDDPWVRTDEWYNFDQNPRDRVRVLLSLDETSYSGGTMGDHPIAWVREQGASRLFYTGLGHTAESYSEPAFLSHLEGGMSWVLEGSSP